MKKILLSLALSSFAFFSALSQSWGPAGVLRHGAATGTLAVPYTAARHVAYKTTSSSFTVTYSNTINASHTDWKGAIEQACSTWGQILTTTHPITVFVATPSDDPSDYPSLLPPSFPAFSGFFTTSDAIGVGASLADFKNFGAGVSNTYYNASLMKFIGGTSALPPVQILIILSESPTYPWNTTVANSCPSAYYDLQTCVMHEICHAIGFSSEAVGDNTDVHWLHTPAYPGIFDRFIEDNATGDDAGLISTSLIGLTPGTAEFTSFCNGTGNYEVSPLVSHGSNDVFFNGTHAGLVQLFAPNNAYETGSSLDHDLGVSDALMSSVLLDGTFQHCPTASEVGVLNDIGWAGANLFTVGFTDFLQISPSASVLDIGSASASFTPSTVYSSGSSACHWSIDLFCNDGSGVVYDVLTGSTSAGTPLPWPSWSPNITSLPAGHIWKRDLNGRIQGTMTVTDLAGDYPASIDIGVNAAPNVPDLTVQNVGGYFSCATKVLKFFSPGADYFQVYEMNNSGGIWSSPGVTTLDPGVQSYTYTGLDETVMHKFYVQGVNSTGSTYSSVITTYPCSWILSLSPNPASANTSVAATISDPGFGITWITITNVENATNISALFDGSSSTVNIDLSRYSLPSGVYVVTAYNSDGNAATAELQTSY